MTNMVNPIHPSALMYTLIHSHVCINILSGAYQQDHISPSFVVPPSHSVEKIGYRQRFDTIFLLKDQRSTHFVEL